MTFPRCFALVILRFLLQLKLFAAEDAKKFECFFKDPEIVDNLRKTALQADVWCAGKPILDLLG